MKRRLLLATSVLLLALWLLPQPRTTFALAGRPDITDERIYDTLLLGVQPGVTDQELADILTPQGLIVTRRWPRFNLIEVRPAASVTASGVTEVAQTEAAYATLAASPLFRYVDYDGAVTIADAPNDPRYSEQWAFGAISTLAGWDITRGSSSTVVAVIDTGVDLAHEDIPLAHLWANPDELDGETGVDDDGNGYVDDIRGWDWTTSDSSPQDENGHGTHVSGVVVAATDNGIGVAGQGGNVKVAALRVLGANGSGTISDLVAGLDYAIDQGFRIVNLSLTVRFDSPALADAVETAADAGVIVVTAAGNQDSVVLWPAAYDAALAVGATASDGSKASFSNFGPELDLAAPGDSILSTYLDNTYRVLSGTSMATPHVSALAALIWSLRPDLTRAQVIDIMTSTADDLNAADYPGQDDYLGAGEINEAAALAKASADFTLSRSPSAAAIAAPDSVALYPVRVTGPFDIPIVKETVEAQVTDSTHTPLGSIVSAATGADGIANLVISTPITAGDYLVRGSVGDITAYMPLKILTAPITVSLTVGQVSVVVAGDAIPLTVTVDAGDAISPSMSLPLLLSTNLGSFANRSNTASFDMTGLIFTGEFFPGTVAGDALIQASVGGYPAAATVRIDPGAAAQIAGELVGIADYTGGDRYDVTFNLTDDYGNVPAPTQVFFTGDQGELTPAQAVSVSGQVTTTLDLPTVAYGTVSVTATTSTALSATVTIGLVEKYYMGPLYLEYDAATSAAAP